MTTFLKDKVKISDNRETLIKYHHLGHEDALNLLSEAAKANFINSFKKSVSSGFEMVEAAAEMVLDYKPDQIQPNDIESVVRAFMLFSENERANRFLDEIEVDGFEKEYFYRIARVTDPSTPNPGEPITDPEPEPEPPRPRTVGNVRGRFSPDFEVGSGLQNTGAFTQIINRTSRPLKVLIDGKYLGSVPEEEYNSFAFHEGATKIKLIQEFGKGATVNAQINNGETLYLTVEE